MKAIKAFNVTMVFFMPILMGIALNMLLLSLAFAKPITIAVSDWPPYTLRADSNGGSQTKRIMEALTQIGDSPKLEWYSSWLTAYNRTKAAINDTSGFWMCNQKRVKFFYYTDPVFMIQHVMFYLKGTQYRWKSLSDLKGKGPFGVTTVYYYGDEFSEAVKKYNFKLREVRLESLVFNLLIHGRVNYVPMDILNGLELIERYVPKDSQSYITFKQEPFDENYLHFIVSKEHPDAKNIVKRLNHAISLLNDKYSKQLQAKTLKYSCPNIDNKL